LRSASTPRACRRAPSSRRLLVRSVASCRGSRETRARCDGTFRLPAPDDGNLA
jgi:hypothetical protein